MFGKGAELEREHNERMAKMENKKEILIEALKNDQGKMVYLKDRALKLAFIVNVKREKGNYSGTDYDNTIIEYLNFETNGYKRLEAVEEIKIRHENMTFDEIMTAIKEAK